MACISLLGAENFGEGLFTFLHISVAGTWLIITTAFFIESPQSLPVFIRWATVGAMLLTLLGLLGICWQNGSFFFSGIMINKNLYAAVLFLFTPFVIHTLGSSRKLWSWPSALLLLILWSLIFLSGARSVVTATILSLIPVILLIPRSQFNLSLQQRKNVCLACFLLAFIFLLVVWGGGRFYSPEKKESVRHRLALWYHTLQIITDYPALGVGPGHWRLARSQYTEPQRIETLSGDIIEIHAQRSHNIFLETAAETGVMGSIIYFSFFICLYVYAWKILKKSKNKTEISLVLAMIYGISGFMIFGMFSYPSERPLHTFLFMTTAGILVSIYHRYYPPRFRPICTKILISILIMSALFCGVISGLRLYSEIHLKKALNAKDQKAWHQVITHIDNAVHPVYSIDPFGVPIFWYRGIAYFHLDNLPKAEEDFRRALEYHPFHTHSINSLLFLENAEKKN
ncbi:MAG: O-antigen ligase family protein [Desulfobacterales bacterium]|nr:O-antigen ligase family protein [Desulfobacterales bacterium]